VGRHDFRSFCENPEGHDSTIVVVESAGVAAAPEADGLVLVRIAASHFLWKMVRRVVGILLEVGAGRMNEGHVARLLVERTADPARLTVPPSGLFLESVGYPGEKEPDPPHPLRPAF
jgi:tRNA pseudouridine38-40 synthase